LTEELAVRTSPEEVFISWRLLAADPAGTGFNLYRGNKKLNRKLLLTTNIIDKTLSDEIYSVRAVIRGKEQMEAGSCSTWKHNFVNIPLNSLRAGQWRKR
jgi:rhamnogalacturonan endolyase